MQPSFDTWTSGFLFGVAMGLFLFVVLLGTKNRKNRPIAFLILAFSIILFQYVLYWTKYQSSFPYLVLFPPLCYFSTGPLLYLYFLDQFKKNPKFNYFLHFLPAILMLVPNVVLWGKYLGITSTEIPFISFIKISHWFIAAHMTAYVMAILLLISKNRHKNTEFARVHFVWSRLLVSLYLLFILSYLAYYILVNFSFFNAEWDYMISITMTLSIYTIGYFIYKEPDVFNGELLAQLFLPIKNKNETFESAMLNEFFDHLSDYMDSEKPYLNNELRLVNLADQLGFSTHLLSKIINKKTDKNFNNFVNDYRLSEAENLLKSAEDMLVKEVYFDVGFNNKNSFYKAFKQKYNCTPTQYRSQALKVD